MAAARSNSARLATPTRRTQIVWASFAGAMTFVGGLLALAGATDEPRSGFPATNVSILGERSQNDSIFRIDQPLDHQRWTGIVIHHSGGLAGDAEILHRQHIGYGLQGLGYHFILGNGAGMSDGQIHVGYRWNEQLPGAHVAGASASNHNQHSIGICLIGNGDRRPFSDGQFRQLVHLVQRLQQEFDIPGHAVHLHRELASNVSSPGRFFPAAELHEQLLP